MRYALISDVHANLPALEAVLAAIAADGGIDAVYHLGDLVGYAPWPNEVVARISAEGIAGVCGNYDSTVALGAAHCGCRYEDAVQEAQSHESFAWTVARVTPGTRKLLAALPFRIDVRPGGGHAPGPKVVLVHGTPTLNTLYWTVDRDDGFCRRMAQHAGARPGDVICFGHTHLPWTREVDGVHFVNTGSVGRPKDGDWRAGYVVLGVGGGAVSVDFVRVKYDVERAMAAIRASELPGAFAEYLRTGGKPRPHTAEIG
ncbi:MAG TPA: metallophosphoesterase family protein [Longimicrobiaceae bacterium]|nr:metallophosphoesterase family protein [Longimicrobiaceae bacterium]